MHALTLMLLATAVSPATDDGSGSGSGSRSGPSTNYGYHQGSIQLFLEAPPYTAQYSVNVPAAIKGFGYNSDGRGDSTIAFGISGGFGYCLTSVVEFGAAVAFNLASVNGNGDQSATNYDFALEPFAKVNLASTFGTGAINPFAMVGPVFGLGQEGVAGGGTTGVIGVDMDLGVEFFISHDWGISTYVPINIIDTAAYGNVHFTIGVGFGLFGYLGSNPIEIKVN